MRTSKPFCEELLQLMPGFFNRIQCTTEPRQKLNFQAKFCSKGPKARTPMNCMIVKDKKSFTRFNGQLISHVLYEVAARFKIGRSSNHSYEAEIFFLTTVHPFAHKAHDCPRVASSGLNRQRHWPVIGPAFAQQVPPVATWRLITVAYVSPAQPTLQILHVLLLLQSNSSSLIKLGRWIKI